MCNCMVKIISAFICTVLSLTVIAQIDLRDYDTIPIQKPTRHKLIYEISSNDFRVLSIRQEKMVTEGNFRSSGEDLKGPKSLMALMGSRPVPNQLYPSFIESDPNGFGWAVDLYLKGTTLSNRLKTVDGKMLDVPDDLMGYWNSGSLGLIRQQADTIATYGVTWQPEKDSLFRPFYLATRSLHFPVDPKHKKWDKGLGHVYNNFGVFGWFKGADLLIMFYESKRVAYIFLNNNLDAIFQIDFDIPGARIIISSGGFTRVPPVLLVRKGVTKDQEADLSRLAIFSMLMAQLTK